ncbi:hypothetical protein ACU4GR_21475 [Methylobacterium oryzae CBMB20]
MDALTALGRRHGLVPPPLRQPPRHGPVTGPDLPEHHPPTSIWLSGPGRPVPSGLLDGIAAVADKAPMGIDGEILLRGRRRSALARAAAARLEDRLRCLRQEPGPAWRLRPVADGTARGPSPA